jgi:hypothetical protein
MTMTGLFHITLLPDADEQAFVTHMTGTVFKDVSALQLTRITAAFRHKLLKGRSEFREYVWQVEVDLVTDHEYDFAENIARVQKSLAGSGVLSGLYVYTQV